MPDLNVYDMSEYQRLLVVDRAPGGRVRGMFRVMSGSVGRDATVWIHPVDVTIALDGTDSGGYVYGSGDFTASVKNGEPDFHVYARKSHEALLHEVRAELLEVLVALAAFEWQAVEAPSSQEPS